VKSNYSATDLRRRRATLNPYWEILVANFNALSVAGERLKWDWTGEAWRSRRRLRQLRDTHAGQTAVIVCNGPSLLKSDLSLLEGTYTFGLNKINLLFDKNAFRPNCIVAVNALVLEQNAAFYNATDIPLFLSHQGLAHVRPRDPVTFLHTLHSPKFARDVSVSINDGGTVTFAALQLAFHLGFRRVGLIGCDHNFAVKGPSNLTVKGEGEDKSHFDPNYFGHGVAWQLPDLEASEMSYRLAQNVFAAFGGEVVNCTEGGLLEIFRRETLRDFLRAGGGAAEARPR
jgi:hypothetical protein